MVEVHGFPLLTTNECLTGVEGNSTRVMYATVGMLRVVTYWQVPVGKEFEKEGSLHGSLCHGVDG